MFSIFLLWQSADQDAINLHIFLNIIVRDLFIKLSVCISLVCLTGSSSINMTHCSSIINGILRCSCAILPILLPRDCAKQNVLWTKKKAKHTKGNGAFMTHIRMLHKFVLISFGGLFVHKYWSHHH